MKDTGGRSGFSFYAGASTTMMLIWIVILAVVLLALWLIGIFSGILRVSSWSQKRYEYEIWLMCPDGSEMRQLTHTRKYKQYPVFMPDSHHVLFLSVPASPSDRTYDLWSASLDSSDPQMIADHTLFDHPMQWRPTSP